MEQLIRHPTPLDPTGSSHPWNHLTSRIATWVWPPVEPDGDAATEDADPPAWSMRTMHWVPLVIPLTALGMLVMAVLIGSRL